jgi:DNA-binding HxlR family transcriptional regulator
MGKNAPSPRQSEYITNPILSQKLRQETDAQLLNRVTFLSRPIKLKTQFKGSTVQRFKNS